VAATLWVIAGTALRVAVSPLVGAFESPFITVHPAMLIVTLRYGVMPGLYALALGLLAIYFLFLPPAFAFSVPASDYYDQLISFGTSGFLEWIVASLLRVTVMERRIKQVQLEAESEKRAALAEQLDTVVHELEHRVKNLVQLVTGIVIRAGASAPSVHDYRNALVTRLKALAGAQSLVARPSGEPVDLDQVLETTLAPFRTNGSVRWNGPPVEIPQDLVVPMCLVLHELATNAVKYGALSAPAGGVRVTWSTARDEVLELSWTESGGPKVAAPEKAGFGTSLLEGLIRGCGGESAARFDPEGLAFSMTLPLRRLAQADAQGAGGPPPGSEAQRDGSG
jgi:two-component sensor histidine kinase